MFCQVFLDENNLLNTWIVCEAFHIEIILTGHNNKTLQCRLGPRRFTNVFDESKINRIRIFTMLCTEYNDSLVRTKYPSDNRSTQRGNPNSNYLHKT